MSYKTIFETPEQHQVIIIKNIFETNNINYRFLDETTNVNFPLGVRVQVKENEASKAEALLRQNGFLNDPRSGRSAVSVSKLWMWIVVGLIILIIASVWISMMM